MILIIDNRIVLAMIKTTELQSNPWIINPREVPAAGGCSVLVITIMIIPIPTEIAADIFSINLESPILNIWTTPTIIRAIIMATTCPPITFLGVAAILSGITKIVKAEEATPTTIAALITLSPTSNIKNNETMAKKHCNRY